MICIVGWDDDYPAENFTHEVYTTDENGNRTVDAERTAKTTPPGNGAWLMKNSRGSETDAIPDGMTAPDGTTYPEHRGDWGIVNEEGLHTGYNWISYYDQSISSPITMEFAAEEDGTETAILQYDYLPARAEDQYVKKSDQPLSAANVFTADRDLEITAVSARPRQENCHITFTIVRLKENAADPEDGEVAAQFSKDFAYAGFHRVETEKPIPMKKGERFSVITTTTFTDQDGKEQWIYYASSGSRSSTNRTVVHPGETFVKENGTWQDWTQITKEYIYDIEEDIRYDMSDEVDNIGIKAFVRYSE